MFIFLQQNKKKKKVGLGIFSNAHVLQENYKNNIGETTFCRNFTPNFRAVDVNI